MAPTESLWKPPLCVPSLLKRVRGAFSEIPNLGHEVVFRPASRQTALTCLTLFQDTGVGKSSIVWRFVEDSFDPNINPTIG